MQMQNATNFLCAVLTAKRNDEDMQYFAQLISAVEAADWDASAHNKAIDAFARKYCSLTNLTVDELRAIMDTLDEQFNASAYIDSIHLQTSEELESWIQQLKAL